jgi:hypothetical protein
MAFGAANDLEATRELGRITAREARALGAHWVYAPVADVNNNSQYAPVELEQIAADAAGCDAVVLAAFVAAAAYRGTLGLTGNYPPFVEKLLGQKPPVILISFGNPYLARAYPGIAACMATYSTAPPSEAAAAARLIP